MGTRHMNTDISYIQCLININTDELCEESFFWGDD
jgi:hypothetical protein